MDKPEFKSKDELYDYLEDKAWTIREKVIWLTGIAGGSHVGGGLSMADIMAVLYFHTMNFDAKQPKWPERDRFILSKGHGAVCLCPTLAMAGFFEDSFLEGFNHFGSACGMHPDAKKIPGVEVSTGSLGHGLSIGVGMGLSARLDGASWRTYVLMGDGELQEGLIWEGAMAAAHYKLGSLVGIVDRNGLEIDGTTEEIMALEPLTDKWASFGWEPHVIDGNSVPELVAAFDALPAADAKKPHVIIANTIKGKGVPFIEGQSKWHYGGIDEDTEQEWIEALKNSRPRPRGVS